MPIYPSISLEQLVTLPSAQTAIITANNRLSVFIKTLLLSHLKAQNKTISLPAISPYKSWLVQLADTLVFYHADMPIVLNETAQQWYWQKAILREDAGEEVLNPSAAAASLSQAHRLQAEWQVDVHDDEINPEYEAFTAWRALYQQEIATLSAWDTPRLANEILFAINNKQLRAPSYLVLLGFYSLSAYQKILLDALVAQGTQVYTLTLHREVANSVQVFQAKDNWQELRAALHWAKQCIQDYPKHKLALVIPSLQEDAAYIRRVLSKTFAGTVLDKRWHMAVGRPLAEWGLVRSVMAWFSLLAGFQKGKVALAKIGEALLNAEFAFDIYQADQLAVLDSCLREEANIALSHAQFVERLKDVHPDVAQIFDVKLMVWNQTYRCADWAQVYRDTLSAFGFPGVMSLSSVNYQLCRAFEQAITNFALLDEMLPALNASDALQLFQQQLMQTSFQAQRAKDIVLDIVGLYETEGGQWDSVWVLGLTDKVLPQAPSPNPYLPVRSQRRCGVMHATPESEMQWANQLFNAILHSAQRVILSWPHQVDDEVLRHSSLLKPYLAQVQTLPEIVDRLTDSLVLEVIKDNKGLPKQGQVKGGYGTLERQSKNPLWAYATLRLNLKQLPAYPDTELNSFLVGNLLHTVMEKCYTDVKYADLHNDDWVNARMDYALAYAEENVLSTISSKVLKALCLQRAKEIALEFIAHDRDKRLPFDVVEVERSYDFSIWGLDFRFKVDRIDRIEQDGLPYYVFIDYKTGSLSRESEYKERWFTRERLLDLQLPLYASVLKRAPIEQVAGIAFANLSRKTQGYVGVWQTVVTSDYKEAKLLSESEWLSINQIWQQKLEGLFQEIAEGEASNRALSHDDLKYCDVIPFLRLHAVEEEEND